MDKRLKIEEWERKIRLFNNIFSKGLQMELIKTHECVIQIPTQERLLLEMTSRVGIDDTIENIYEYYSDLAGDIDAFKFQELLENCTSERTRRLALFLSEETESLHFPKLNLQKIPLNIEKNWDFTFNDYESNHILKYNL